MNNKIWDYNGYLKYPADIYDREFLHIRTLITKFNQIKAFYLNECNYVNCYIPKKFKVLFESLNNDICFKNLLNFYKLNFIDNNSDIIKISNYCNLEILNHPYE